MATTSSLTGVQVTIPAGRTLQVTCRGRANIDIVAGVLGAGSTTLRVDGNSRNVGPFGADAVVNVRSVRGDAVRYDDVPQSRIVSALVDPVSPSGLLDANGRPMMSQPRAHPGSNLFDFSDATAWTSAGGSVTRSSDPSKTLGGMVPLKMNFGAGDTLGGVKRTFATTFQIQTGVWLRMLVFIEPTTYASTTCTIRFSSDAATTKNLSFTIPNGYFSPGYCWVTFRAGEDGSMEFQGDGAGAGRVWTATGGQAWGDQFNYCDVSFSGQASKSMWIYALQVGVRPAPRIVFNTDGTDSTILSIMARQMYANNWVGTAFFDSDMGTLTGSLSMIKRLLDYGWEIGTQGLTHTDYITNGRNIGADFDTATANFLALGLPPPKTFAYPLNSSSRANDEILAGRGVVWRRGSGNPVVHNIGLGAPNAYDGMIRSGTTALSGANFNQGPAYLQAANRLKAIEGHGGFWSNFTHNIKSNNSDGLGGDLTHWGLWMDAAKVSEATYGTKFVRAMDVKPQLEAEIFV